MISCVALVEAVCVAFRDRVFDLCLRHWTEAVSYKHIVCGLNPDCCG